MFVCNLKMNPCITVWGNTSWKSFSVSNISFDKLWGFALRHGFDEGLGLSKQLVSHGLATPAPICLLGGVETLSLSWSRTRTLRNTRSCHRLQLVWFAWGQFGIYSTSNQPVHCYHVLSFLFLCHMCKSFRHWICHTWSSNPTCIIMYVLESFYSMQKTNIKCVCMIYSVYINKWIYTNIKIRKFKH